MSKMAIYTKEHWNEIKENIMVNSFDCFAERGLLGTGTRALVEYCGYRSNLLYTYFENLDDLIIQSTEFCMSKVEDEFMQISPKDFSDLNRFLDEVPYWTAENHGKKYRLMYQIYTHPKYREHGKKFFEGVNQRYSDYADEVSHKIDLPVEFVRPMIFVFVRACVHFALYEDEFYLQEQLRLIKEGIKLFTEKYGKTE